jgi:hypothetical protein
MIPAGVSDLCDQARYTIARVTGTAIMAFILRRSWKWGEEMEDGRAVDMQASFLNAYSIRGTQVNVLPRGSNDTHLLLHTGINRQARADCVCYLRPLSATQVLLHIALRTVVTKVLRPTNSSLHPASSATQICWSEPVCPGLCLEDSQLALWFMDALHNALIQRMSKCQPQNKSASVYLVRRCFFVCLPSGSPGITIGLHARAVARRV